MELRTVKGTRDFLPEDKILRDTLIQQLKTVFELYGYNPIETPALELEETLSSKYAGGAEILKEVFTLTDNADRKLGLRYDLTVPFARVIASNPQLKKPFKRYQIDRVWRNGPIKLGRYREFYQCDVDVIGIQSVAAEAELFAIIQTFFSQINCGDIVIKVNNRKILDGIMEQAQIPLNLRETTILSLDKRLKIGVEGVTQELKSKGLDESQIAAVFSLVENKTLLDYETLLPNNEGVREMKECFAYAENFGVTVAEFDVTLARGLSYYTSTVWEVYIKGSEITSSAGAGGRFDTMIGQFMQSKEAMPAVGTSFGLEVIVDALKLKNKNELKTSITELYCIPLKTLSQTIPIAMQFRNAGIKTDIDLNGRAMNKNLDFANKNKIPFVAMIGENEIALQKIMLKNLQTGEQELLSIDETIALIRKTLS